MPTTSSTRDKQLSPLTADEEQLFQRILSRLEAYFRDFEEIEGFSVLGSNLHRLFRKVALELRCVCYEYHDTYQLIDTLRAQKEAQHAEMEQQRELCDQVIAQAEDLMQRFHEAQQTNEHELHRLHEFYAAQEALVRKQCAVESDKQLRQEVETLVEEHTKRVQLLSMEHDQQLQATKKQVESKKEAELEYMQVQLRLQITGQVSRDLGKKLARQEKICVKHTDEMKQMQRKITALQDLLKSRTAHRKQTA